MAREGLREEDQPGFDPFREDYPAHEPVPVGSIVRDLLGEMDPPSGSMPPPPTRVLCGICHKSFQAKAGWFFGKWRHGSLCSDCTDGNSLPAGFLAECKRPPVRQMSCPRCGIRRGVDPTLQFNLWHYALTCSHCGATAVAVFRLRRKCEECQEDYNVDEKHPRKVCAKCHKAGSGKGPY
jgi:hypothetical protein